MNWYIGQKVVCIRDHSQGVIREGQQFSISGLRLCKCGAIELNVGVSSKGGDAVCSLCNHIRKSDGAWWFKEIMFAPIEPKHELSEHTTETLIEELEEQLQPR